MAMSRTYLGAHWASDVIAGSCIGTGLAVVWAASLELERGRRRSATPSSGPGHAGRPEGRVMRTISIVLLGVGLACVVALHVLRPDLTPAGHRLSEYAIGSYGAMMTVAFVSIGAGLLALASPLARAGGRCSRVVPAAVFAAGTGMVVAGIYRTDPSHSGVTADAVHSRASAFATLALIGAALAWSVVRARRWDITTSLALLAAVLGAVSPFLHRSRWTGLSQRMLWLTLLAWLIVIASRLAPAVSPASRRSIGPRSLRVTSSPDAGVTFPSRELTVGRSRRHGDRGGGFTRREAAATRSVRRSELDSCWSRVRGSNSPVHQSDTEANRCRTRAGRRYRAAGPSPSLLRSPRRRHVPAYSRSKCATMARGRFCRGCRARGRPHPVHASDAVTFWRALTIGLLLCAAYAVLPASWSVLRYLVIYPAAGLLAAVSVLVGVRRFRPVAPQAWILIGAGCAAT